MAAETLPRTLRSVLASHCHDEECGSQLLAGDNPCLDTLRFDDETTFRRWQLRCKTISSMLAFYEVLQQDHDESHHFDHLHHIRHAKEQQILSSDVAEVLEPT